MYNAQESDVSTILADDLSGAQEALAAVCGPAASMLDPNPPAGLLMVNPATGLPDPGAALAFDLDVRQCDPCTASQALRTVLDRVDAAGRGTAGFFVKIDSIVRGPVGALTAEASRRAPVLFSPAVPMLGRVVRDGAVFVSDRPLASTDLWSLEQKPVPGRLEELFSVPTHTLGLDVVRSAALTERITAPEGRRILIADAETNEDCDRLVDAAITSGAILVGAAGLALALGRRVSFPAVQMPRPRRSPITVVVGSAATAAAAQVDALSARGVPVAYWTPGHDVPKVAGDHVLVPTAPLEPARSEELNREFAAAVATHRAGHHLVLTGGQTARAVLDALGVDRLHLLGQSHHGAVISLRQDRLLVGTRPGSFGDRHSLARILDALRTAQNPTLEGNSL